MDGYNGNTPTAYDDNKIKMLYKMHSMTEKEEKVEEKCMTDKEMEEKCIKIAKQCIKDNKIIFDALAKL